MTSPPANVITKTLCEIRERLACRIEREVRDKKEEGEA